ncbi:MAG: hypothetical protein ACRDBM_14580 [Sporomusa sp.]
MFLLVETELWPNCLKTARELNIPPIDHHDRDV